MLGMSNTKQSVFKTLKNKNKLMLLAFGIGFILQFIVVEFTPISNFFMTTSLSLKEWAWLVLISSLPLFAHELFVIFKRN
jgi:Ca2+-transporting ATPase